MKNDRKQLLTPDYFHPEDPLQTIRERTLFVVLSIAAAIGSVFLGLRIYNAVQIQFFEGVFQITLWYIGILLIAFIQKIPFKIRVVIGMFYLYGFGVNIALRYGLIGETLTWLLCLSIFSVLYLGLQVGLWTTFLSTATLMVVGVGLESGWIPATLMKGALQSRPFSMWVNSSMLYFLIGVISVYVINAMIKGLDQRLSDSEKNNLELKTERDRFENSSRVLESREAQLHTAAQISRSISSHLDPEILFDQVVELIRERFDLYYVGVFILDQEGQFAVLRAGSGEAGKAMVEAGHKLPINDTSMIGWAISHHQAKIALDVGQDAIHLNNPNLPKTRSELALPMIKSKRIVGAITVQSEKPNAFDKNVIVALQGISDSLAIAYENSTLFQQIEMSFDEIQRLNQLYLTEAWSETLGTKGDIKYSFENIFDDMTSTDSQMKIEKPIILRDQIIGSIVLDADHHSWDPEDETFIEAVATQASLALENIRLMEATQMSARHNRVVADLSNKIWASADIDTILRTTLIELTQALQASNGFIQLEIRENNEITEINGPVSN